MGPDRYEIGGNIRKGRLIMRDDAPISGCGHLSLNGHIDPTLIEKTSKVVCDQVPGLIGVTMPLSHLGEHEWRTRKEAE